MSPANSHGLTKQPHYNVGHIKQDEAGNGQMCSDNISREKA